MSKTRKRRLRRQRKAANRRLADANAILGLSLVIASLAEAFEVAIRAQIKVSRLVGQELERQLERRRST